MSDRYIENGTYLRIQNVTLGYNFPEDIIRKVAVAKSESLCFGTESLHLHKV